MTDSLLKVKISGTVQGVFFRHSAKLKAQELNLNGFIRNENDGSVYSEAEGDKEKLDEFLAWCRKGPPLAIVDKIDFSFDKSGREFSGFEIR